jgi:hypothetical protein
MKLGHFRGTARRLLAGVSGTVDELRAHVETVYAEEVLPALEQLRTRMDENRWGLWRGIIKATGLTTLSSVLPFAALDVPWQAQVAGATVGVGTSTVSYKRSRQRLLGESPYSYLLQAEQAFTPALQK